MGSARRMLVIGLVAICFDALFQSAVPAVFRTVLNELQEDPAAFVAQGWKRAAFEAVVVMFGFLVFAYIGHTFTLRGASRWANHLRVEVFDHVQHLSADYFARNHVGDLASRINQDVERFEIALRQLMVITWTIVMIVLAIVFIAWIDPVVALVAVGLFALGAIASALVLPRQRRLNREVRDEIGATSGVLSELLSLNPLIKAYTGERRATAQVAGQTDDIRDRSEHMIRLQYRFGDAFGAYMAFFAPFVLLFVSAWRAADGVLLIGDVVAIWAFWQRASGALSALTVNLPELLAGLAAADRVADVLRETPTVAERPNAVRLTTYEPLPISFDHVSFRYPEHRGTDVLHDLKFDVNAGERVALVGPSGAGKSTVCQLLLRFYDADAGAVRIGGHDVRDLRLDSLRDHVGIVFQESVFFAGTLFDNLRLGSPDADEAAMRVALESALAWDFVSTWPDGLDTRFGERGLRVSGGERQRLAIARVLLRDPAIVLLDEPTSALDAGSEVAVLSAIERLLEGRTSITVAHRMATIREADRIIVMGAGEVVDHGTHDDLLERCAVYQSYCRHQSVA
ncbi:MAG: ABC transporter ATP-binding protein [Ilumatobacteraceae bacterium]